MWCPGGSFATDASKIQLVRDCPPPPPPLVHSFHVFCFYYWGFVAGFAKVCLPISQLMVEEAKFVWLEECQDAFVQLKVALCTAPKIRALTRSEQKMIFRVRKFQDYLVGAQSTIRTDNSALHLLLDAKELEGQMAWCIHETSQQR